jgi:hypothetical protein
MLISSSGGHHIFLEHLKQTFAATITNLCEKNFSASGVAADSRLPSASGHHFMTL